VVCSSGFSLAVQGTSVKARKRLLVILLGLLAIGPATPQSVSANADGVEEWAGAMIIPDGDLQLPEAGLLAIFGIGLTIAAGAARRWLRRDAGQAGDGR
jgi:hypothetical protein